MRSMQVLIKLLPPLRFEHCPYTTGTADKTQHYTFL